MASTAALRAASPMRSQIFSPTKSIPVLGVSFLGRSRYASIATRAARAAAARTSVISTFVTLGSAIYLLSFCAVAGATSRLLKNSSCRHSERYSLVEREDVASGKIVQQVRLTHAPGAVRRYLARCTPGTAVALEATGNWYWIVEEIEQAGLQPRLVHPRKAKL